MSYATIADFEQAFPTEAVELTTFDATAEATDEDALQQALDLSSSQIDSHLRGQYQLPLATIPTLLKSLCLDIARYRLDRNSPMEDVRKRYEDALRTLKALATGDVTLDIGESDTAVIQVRAIIPKRVWDEAGLAGFGV